MHQSFGSLGNNRIVIDTINFPESNMDYSEIIMEVNLDCPNGGCDPWDRKAKISVQQFDEWFEIGRYVTPYGVECGWSFDVTDYRSLLQGEVLLKSYIDTWVRPGWLVTITFNFISGDPEHPFTIIRNVWNYDYIVYGDNTIPINIPTITEYVPSDVEDISLRMITTGHGQGNTDNAAEFSYRVHDIILNGDLSYSHDFWRNDCASNQCSPQNGTWQYDRAGFCPGDKVLFEDFDLSNYVLNADTINLEYRLEDYINYCSPNNSSCVDGSTCAQCSYNNSGHTEPFYYIGSHLVIHTETYHSNADTYFKLIDQDSTDSYIELYLENYVPIYGFQLVIDLDNVGGVSPSIIEFQDPNGGRAEESGWTVGINDSGMVIGLAHETGSPISAGEGVLTSIFWNGQDIPQIFGTITITDLNVSGYFGDQLSSEIGLPLVMNSDLNIMQSNTTPFQVKLHSAYPNPFNPIVKIPFDISKRSKVALSIFDIKGKKIDSVIKTQFITPGNYISEWDGSSHPSGMYFYTLQVDHFVQTKKIIYIK